MKIVCDACSAKYSIADEKVRGKVFKIRCKKCSNIIVVRGSNEEAEKQAAEALEQKETRVFDYSGYDDPQAAVAAADASAAAGGVWHIVVDQEQVGPMTSDEVRSYAARGDIDAESYIWREGFDDWLALSSVPEFADLGAAPAPAVAATSTDSAAAAMFGAPAVDDMAAADAGDPADIFSAQAQGSANLGDDGGLFGDVGGAPMTAGAPDAGGGLFGSAPEPAAAEAAGNGAGSPNLTGQRSENSVLFSLNNLASLASEGPKASAPAPSSAPAGMAQAGGQEGSGLIDIRSMAQVYLGDKGASPAASSYAGSASIDDLPIFSQPSFEAAAPVLLPAAAPANQNKLLVGLIAAVGVLVVAAVILLVVVLKGGDDKQVAAAGGDDVTKTGGDGDKSGDGDKDGTKPAGDGDGDGDKAGDGDGDTTKTSATGGDTGAAKPKVEDKPKKPEKPMTAAELKREREKEKKRKEEREKRKAEREEKKRLEAERNAKNSPKSGGCDEVACLVDPNKACCKKGRSSSSSSSDKPKVDSSKPEKLTSSDIRKGMGKVGGRARSCGNKHSGSGKVAVSITVGGSGRVTRASASGATPGLRSCVASAVKRARFKSTQKGARFTYKYSF